MNLLLADDQDKGKDVIVSLVVRAQKGDKAAFEKLFCIYSHCICKYLRSKTRNDEDTCDLLQDSFLDAWLHLQELHDPASFRAWLYTIARNKALNHIRHENIVHRLLWRWKDPDTPIVIDGPSPHEWILLHLALEKVKPIWRECLILHVIHDLSLKEIAVITGKSDRTVRRYINDVKEQISEIYQYLDILFRMEGF